MVSIVKGVIEIYLLQSKKKADEEEPPQKAIKPFEKKRKIGIGPSQEVAGSPGRKQVQKNPIMGDQKMIRSPGSVQTQNKPTLQEMIDSEGAVQESGDIKQNKKYRTGKM